MSRLKANNKGVALLFVLATMLIVVCFAISTLSQLLSHSRFSLHQVTRIQAYYATLAGLNLAMDQLRQNNWGTGTYHLCKSGCSLPDINDPDIPYTVTITIFADGTSIAGAGVVPGRKITASTTYTSSYSYR